jgi:dTDP-4-amino-4,6-dideoxygalactose transaminase
VSNTIPVTIPLFDPNSGADRWRHEVELAIREVVESGRFILGPKVEAFENEFAAWLGVRHAIGVNSGTDALVIALRALGISPGDEVITSPFTFVATAEAVRIVGATPVFVDIDPRSYNLDPERIARRISPRTKAILPVHLYGLAAEMKAIRELAAKYELKILEDVAQACGGKLQGRMLGTWGDAAAFSFFPSKTLGAFGDAGLIATNDDHLAEVARMLRVHGAPRKHHVEAIGYNSRLDEIQAAVLRVKLRYLDEGNATRRRSAAQYTGALSGLTSVTTPGASDDAEHVYHQYTVRISGGRRDAVRRRMAEAGVQTGIYYPVPIHRLPVYAAGQSACPVAEAASGEVLSLPIGPDMTAPVLEQVVHAFRGAVAANNDN